jgi:hypothetical protein
MPNSIRIKRRASGGSAGAPSSLLNAELAFNEQDNILYYGTGTGGLGGSATTIIPIAGPGGFVDRVTTQSIAGLKTFSANTAFSSDVIITGDLSINGGDIYTSSSTFNIANNNAFTVGFARSANNITIGATTGTTTVRNKLSVVGGITIAGDTIFAGDLAVNGGDLTSTSAIFNALSTSTTINFGASATLVNIGSASGNTHILSNLDVDGDVNIDGGDLTVSTTTFNLANTNALAVNAFGAASAIVLGAATGTITISNPTVVGSIATQNLWNTVATTVNAFGVASSLNLGATSGTATISNPTVVGSQTTQNLWNTVATTVNAFGAATTAINIGASTGILTIKTPTVVGTETVQNLWNTAATTVNAFGVASSLNLGASTGTATISNPTVVGSIATQNLWNTVATTVNAFGVASSLNLGATSGTATISNPTVVGSIATQNLWNTVATTVNAFGAATLINIGAPTGTTAINNDVTIAGTLDVTGTTTFTTDVIVGGDLTVNGTLTSINSSTITVDDKNLELGSVVATEISAVGVVGSVTGGTSGTITGMSSTTGLIVGSAITAVDGVGSIGVGVLVASIINKTSITITATSGISAGSVTNITTGGATDVTADGGGFTLKGLTDKTFNWINATDSWTSSENLTLASGRSFFIDSASVLSANTLGSGVIYSSLTTLGTISTGVWSATTILANRGGTGFDTYAIGDILYADSTSTLAKLPKGTAYQFLQMNAGVTAPEWVSVIDGGSF